MIGRAILTNYIFLGGTGHIATVIKLSIKWFPGHAIRLNQHVQKYVFKLQCSHYDENYKWFTNINYQYIMQENIQIKMV